MLSRIEIEHANTIAQKNRQCSTFLGNQFDI